MVVELPFVSAVCTKSELLFDAGVNFAVVCVVGVLDEISVAVLVFSMSWLLRDTGITVKVASLCSLEMLFFVSVLLSGLISVVGCKWFLSTVNNFW